jgi:hypothetical protein
MNRQCAYTIGVWRCPRAGVDLVVIAGREQFVCSQHIRFFASSPRLKRPNKPMDEDALNVARTWLGREPLTQADMNRFDTRPAWMRAYHAYALPVFERDGWTCQRCGSHHDLTVDHIVPRAGGGSDDPSNLQTLCRSCNSSKRDYLPAEIYRCLACGYVDEYWSRGGKIYREPDCPTCKTTMRKVA